MEFEDKMDNEHIDIDINTKNQAVNSENQMIENAAKILEKNKENVIFQDTYSDLESEKFDIPVSENMFLGADFAEKQEQDYHKRLSLSRKLSQRLDEPIENYIGGDGTVMRVAGIVVVIIVLIYLCIML